MGACCRIADGWRSPPCAQGESEAASAALQPGVPAQAPLTWQRAGRESGSALGLGHRADEELRLAPRSWRHNHDFDLVTEELVEVRIAKERAQPPAAAARRQTFGGLMAGLNSVSSGTCGRELLLADGGAGGEADGAAEAEFSAGLVSSLVQFGAWAVGMQ